MLFPPFFLFHIEIQERKPWRTVQSIRETGSRSAGAGAGAGVDYTINNDTEIPLNISKKSILETGDLARKTSTKNYFPTKNKPKKRYRKGLVFETDPGVINGYYFTFKD